MAGYFPKLIEIDELSPEGEPSVQLIVPGELGFQRHVKTASEALDFIKHVRPIPGKTIILVLAMTAGEFYGPNRNGDAWAERPLAVGPTKIPLEGTLPETYKTFETMAKVYKHHIHSDPNKSIGDVLRAFYNYTMHRVELLLALDNIKAENIIQEMHKGVFPPVSMGCRIPYDVCSICGNKAPTRKQYCSHVRLGRMNTLDPAGIVRFVWNPFSKFFDISVIRRPADRLGFTMKKVAHAIPEIHSSALLGEYLDDLRRKSAAAAKLSVMHKIIVGLPTVSKSDNSTTHNLTWERAVKQLKDITLPPITAKLAPFSDSTLDTISAYPLNVVIPTLASLGVILTTPEFVKYLMKRMHPEMEISEDIIRKIVHVQRVIFELMAKNPEVLADLEATGIFKNTLSPLNIDHTLRRELQRAAATKTRNINPDSLKDKIAGLFYETPDPRGMQDIIYVTNPADAKQYKTTRYAARLAGTIADERRNADLTGSVASLASAALLYAIPGVKILAPQHIRKGVSQFNRAISTYPTTTADDDETVIYLQAHPLDTAKNTDFGGTELIRVKNSAHVDYAPDIVISSLKLMMDVQQTTKSAQATLADIKIDTDLELHSFEELSTLIGKLIVE